MGIYRDRMVVDERHSEEIGTTDSYFLHEGDLVCGSRRLQSGVE